MKVTSRLAPRIQPRLKPYLAATAGLYTAPLNGARQSVGCVPRGSGESTIISERNCSLRYEPPLSLLTEIEVVVRPDDRSGGPPSQYDAVFTEMKF